MHEDESSSYSEEKIVLEDEDGEDEVKPKFPKIQKSINSKNNPIFEG